MESKEALPFIGLGCVVIGIFIIWWGKHKRKVCTEKIVAEIIKIEKDLDSDGNETQTPIFGYTVDGKEYKGKLTILVQRNKFHVGDKREILYNPNKPSDFIDGNGGSHTTIGVGFIIIGIIVIVAGFMDL